MIHPAHAAICHWAAQEHNIAYPSDRLIRMLTGMPLWGEQYIQRFVDWTLPSLLTSKDALDQAGWELVIYTSDARTAAKLGSIFMNRGIVGQIREIAKPVLDAVIEAGGISKYWLLAAVHNLLICEAGKRGAGWHMMVGDIVYSDRYMERLLGLAQRHEGIPQGGLTVSHADAEPLLRRFFRSDGTLAVPAAELGQIGWQHMVGEWKSWTTDGIEPPFDTMPNSHFIHYRSTDRCTIHCGHMSAQWLSPRFCAQVKPQVGGTIDSELPHYIGQDFYIPRFEDQMTYVALDDSRSVPTPRVDFASFRQSLLGDYGGQAAFLDYFRAPNVVPCLPTDGFPDEQTVQSRFAALMARIEEP